MKKKSEHKFDIVLHEIKYLITDIAKERKFHDEKIEREKNRYDKKINRLLKKGTKLLEDAQELYYGLTEEDKRSDEDV